MATLSVALGTLIRPRTTGTLATSLVLCATALLVLPTASADHIQYADTSLCHTLSQVVLSSNLSSCSTKHQPWGGYPHTNVRPAIIRVLLERQATKFPQVFILEVGSFSGGSSIRIVGQAIEMQLPPDRFCMMCVDTWLGDVNMIADIYDGGGVNGFRSWLHWDTYHQAHIMQAYCGNLNQAGVAASVVPFRAPSIVGMKTLQRFVDARGLMRPSLIYLDSAHEALETLIELGIAWTLLPEDGIIFGDDWGWVMVATDVKRFAYLNGLTVHLLDGQWVLHKPNATQLAVNPPPAGRTLAFDRNFQLTSDIDGQVVVTAHANIDSLKAAVAAL